MKALSRDFTLREKILLLILALVLMALGYYFFVDQSVRNGIEIAQADYDMYSDQLTTYQMKIAQLESMKEELDGMGRDKTRMPSYNASKEELELLNNVLSGAEDYSIAFTDITRTGDQIRRSFTLQFVTADYDTARSLLAQLEKSEYRCKLGTLYISPYNGRDRENAISVSVSAIFYETMVGGTADSGLPADSKATETNTDTETDTDTGL